MAISNELSSEIAAAVLGHKRNPQELKALGDMLLHVHNELQKMSNEARTERLRTKVLSKPAVRDGRTC
jgi:hypothetical protein